MGGLVYTKDMPKVKLNKVEVESLKESYENGGMSQVVLARVYGVSQAQISRIVTNQQRCEKH